MAVKPRLRFGPLLAAALAVASPAWAAGLHAGALHAYSVPFQPDAVFTDQYQTPAGQIVPYGSSTLAQAKTHTRKFRATSKVAEKGEIVRIALGADRRT